MRVWHALQRIPHPLSPLRLVPRRGDLKTMEEEKEYEEEEEEKEEGEEGEE